MSTMTASTTGRWPRKVGKVYASISIANNADVENADAGLIEADAVRRFALSEVLVDTGATTLCLPPDLIRGLGLRRFREVLAETATGPVTARIFSGVLLTVEGREATTDVLELPGGSQPLLGTVPFEMLGIELDLQQERIRLLPDHGPGTYITAY